MPGLVRRHLTEGGQLSEARVRVAASQLAELLAGGKNGFSWDYGEAAGKGHDPDGCFRLVTEGRQSRWKDAKGRWRSYSACEDLHAAVWLRLLGLPPVPSATAEHVLRWCNRLEAERSWRPGWNLRSLMHYRGACWRQYGARTEWDIGPGDVVQILNQHGGHTMVILDVTYRDGVPVTCDTAEYGQHHQPEGASRADHSCRCRYNLPITDGPKGWHIRGRRVYGRGSGWELVRRVATELGVLPPAWVPEGFQGGEEPAGPVHDTDPAPPPDSVRRQARILKLGREGPDVLKWQELLDGWRYRGQQVLPETRRSGVFDGFTHAATVAFQHAERLTIDGKVGPQTRGKAGLR